jgi:predicted metalloprotease
VFGDPNALSGLQQTAAPPAQQGEAGAPADQQGKFVSQILGSTEDVWTAELAKQGARYEAPQTVLYSDATSTGCGLGQAAMGPFYCPQDRKVYIDLAFFRELSERFGAPGDFARAYVIAHEVGHHVQNLLGASDQVDAARRRGGRTQANRLSVRLELQADCYAGIWAARADSMRHWLESGDVEKGLAAASAVGDDTLQKETQGRVVPDAFTHGTSAQRTHWFETGLKATDLQASDTFSGDYSDL